jgi:hypothetical protein
MSVVINGSAGVTTNSGAVYDGIQRGTAITLTNQTAPEFTGIPSWVRRITVMFQGVSTNSTGNILIQIGSGSYTTSGYLGAVAFTGSGSTGANITTGFGVANGLAATSVLHAVAVITNITGNAWAYGINGGFSSTAAGINGGGSISLSGTLDRLRLFIDGTQQFDAGTINILFE